MIYFVSYTERIAVYGLAKNPKTPNIIFGVNRKFIIMALEVKSLSGRTVCFDTNLTKMELLVMMKKAKKAAKKPAKKKVAKKAVKKVAKKKVAKKKTAKKAKKPAAKKAAKKPAAKKKVGISLLKSSGKKVTPIRL